MRSRLTYLIVVLTLTGSVQALVFRDSFDRAWDDQSRFIDYKAWSEGGDVSIGDWDGFIGGADTIVAYNYVDGFPYALGQDVEGHRTPYPEAPDDPEELNGVLLISSRNTRWDEDNNSGVYLYKNIEGDFIAEVEIVSRDYWWHHGGGLMARVDNPEMNIDREDWLYVSHFPVDDVGNHARSMNDGEGGELGVKGYPSDPFLQIERRGDTFFLRSSPDGVLWTSLPGLEQGLVRTDIPDTMQIGIWQATYSELVGTMMFDNFSIVPEPATVALLGLGALALICWKRS